MKDMLKSRNFSSPSTWCLCFEEEEFVDHLLVQCPVRSLSIQARTHTHIYVCICMIKPQIKNHRWRTLDNIDNPYPRGKKSSVDTMCTRFGKIQTSRQAALRP